MPIPVEQIVGATVAKKKELAICELSETGEGGIRTPGRFYPTLAFQASTLNRSATSPRTDEPRSFHLLIVPARGPRTFERVVTFLERE